MSTNNMCLVFAVLIFIGCILSFKVSVGVHVEPVFRRCDYLPACYGVRNDSAFFVRLSGSQRAAGQGQQGTNSCQVHSPLTHGRVCGRSRGSAARWDTKLQSTVQSNHAASPLSSEWQRCWQGWACMTGSSHWKTSLLGFASKCQSVLLIWISASKERAKVMIRRRTPKEGSLHD